MGRACISDPEIDGEVVADHVWVLEIPHWLQHKDQIGEQVEFTAIPKPYQEKVGGQNYCLSQADALQFLHRPPALSIPDFLDDEECCSEPEMAEDSPAQTINPFNVIREVKTFAKMCGGLEKAEQTALAFQSLTIPISQLVAWLKALKEE